jgi:hypothetical protein
MYTVISRVTDGVIEKYLSGLTEAEADETVAWLKGEAPRIKIVTSEEGEEEQEIWADPTYPAFKVLTPAQNITLYRVKADNSLSSPRPSSDQVWDTQTEAWVTDPDYIKPGAWETDAFIDRFTDAEWAGIWAAIQASPAMAKWYSKAAANGSIRAVSPDTQAGMAALVATGLLTEERRDEILDPDWVP